MKIANNPDKKLGQNLALVKANYNIMLASRFEIMMSFLVYLNFLMFLVSGGIAWLLSPYGYGLCVK